MASGHVGIRRMQRSYQTRRWNRTVGRWTGGDDFPYVRARGRLPAQTLTNRRQGGLYLASEVSGE